MDSWKIRALGMSLPYVSSAISMLITFGSEIFVIIDGLKKTGIDHTNYAVYFSMFMEIYIQVYFYPTSKYKHEKISFIILFVSSYLLVNIAGMYSSNQIIENSKRNFICTSDNFKDNIDVLNCPCDP